MEKIRDFNLQGQQLFSLDVSSLFTSVPLTETIAYLCQYIEDNQLDIGIPSDDLKELLLACTYNVQFLFNNHIYRQKDGVAMGSPLGPLLADVFMSKLENTQLRETIDELNFYKRYVDDILCISSRDANLDAVLAVFNNCHPNINFTCENEVNGQISFLDVNICQRQDGSVQRKVHRKNTWNDQYIHFESFVPMKQKRNLIRCLTNRALKICSTDTLQKELEYIEQIFVNNGYPARFVKRNIDSVTQTPKPATADKKRVYISLPFKGDAIAEVITRRLKSAIEATYPAAQLCVSFRSNPVLRTQLKDILPCFTTSYCVYSFECSCGASYIGRTSRRLSERIREHIPTNLSRCLNNTSVSSIAMHLAESNHQVNQREAFKIVQRIRPSQSKFVKLRLLSIAEAICIRLRNPDLCAQKRFVRSITLPWPNP